MFDGTILIIGFVFLFLTLGGIATLFPVMLSSQISRQEEAYAAKSQQSVSGVFNSSAK